jgi:hypothetical protein
VQFDCQTLKIKIPNRIEKSASSIYRQILRNLQQDLKNPAMPLLEVEVSPVKGKIRSFSLNRLFLQMSQTMTF